MRKIFLSFSILIYAITLQAQDFDTKKMRYIEQFKYWAMDEQIRTGVPAAISLAQGILETGSGTSELSTEANNHFGIKCKKEWTGETYLHDDDRRRECFRKYKSAKESYIDHSNFLKERAHYASLFDLDITDYQAWSKGLRKAGYATNPKYATRLIQLIEKYNLQEYTYEAIELAKENIVAEVVPAKDKPVEKVEVPKAKEKVEVVQVAPKVLSRRPKVKRVYDKEIIKNGRNGFWAHKGDYLLPEAVQYNIRYAKLLAINDLEDERLKNDMFIYLKKKAKKGDRFFHKVKEGENMHYISQETGVQLKYLYIYNNLYDNEEPAVGEKIYLQARSKKTPKLRGQLASTTVNTTEIVTPKKIKKPIPAVKDKIVKEKVAIVKKEKKVEKIIVPEKQNKLSIIEKKDAITGVKKDLETETAKRTIPVKQKIIKKELVQKEIQKRTAPEKVMVVEKKPSNLKASIVAQSTSTSPILNLAKAKKVESLMGDGSKEIEKIYFKNQEALKVQKVIPAPATNNQNLAIGKAKKMKLKKKLAPKKEYNEKDVSDDVKDLKKKFDNLIYEED